MYSPEAIKVTDSTLMFQTGKPRPSKRGTGLSPCHTACPWESQLQSQGQAFSDQPAALKTWVKASPPSARGTSSLPSSTEILKMLVSLVCISAQQEVCGGLRNVQACPQFPFYPILRALPPDTKVAGPTARKGGLYQCSGECGVGERPPA